ncbi:MAG: hypothetical protein JW855_05240 [Gammaproteobacteria bacterium]|nr:hypothetical protein [Gammaproteobacteria bacterium]
MANKRKSWGKFIVDGNLEGTDDGSHTTSGMNFLKSLTKVPLALLQQVKQNRLAITLSKQARPELGPRPSLGPPRPSPGPGSPYSPFRAPSPEEEEPEDEK